MSSPKEGEFKDEMEKNGRAPAIVAGGMRVAHKNKKNSETENTVSNEPQEDGSDELAEIRQSNNVLASSGLAGKVKLFLVLFI